MSNRISGSCFIWGQTGKESSLGLGEINYASIPIELPSPDNSGFLQISHNLKHSALITGNGSLYVFGASTHGQLGLGENVHTGILGKLIDASSITSLVVKTPRKVSTLSDIKCLRVSCGLTHTGIVTEDGDVWTWGFGGSNWGV